MLYSIGFGFLLFKNTDAVFALLQAARRYNNYSSDHHKRRVGEHAGKHVNKSDHSDRSIMIRDRILRFMKVSNSPTVVNTNGTINGSVNKKLQRSAITKSQKVGKEGLDSFKAKLKTKTKHNFYEGTRSLNANRLKNKTRGRSTSVTSAIRNVNFLKRNKSTRVQSVIAGAMSRLKNASLQKQKSSKRDSTSQKAKVKRHKKMPKIV